MKSTLMRYTGTIFLLLLILCCSGCTGLRCKPHCADISGAWNIIYSPDVSSHPITIEQNGCTFIGFIGTGEDIIHGVVYENEIRFAQFGPETMEGPSFRAEGNYFDGGRIGAVFTTPDGETGYWIGSRQQ